MNFLEKVSKRALSDSPFYDCIDILSRLISIFDHDLSQRVVYIITQALYSLLSIASYWHLIPGKGTIVLDNLGQIYGDHMVEESRQNIFQ